MHARKASMTKARSKYWVYGWSLFLLIGGILLTILYTLLALTVSYWYGLCDTLSFALILVAFEMMRSYPIDWSVS